MNLVDINYSNAQLLAENGNEIIVYEPSSGDSFNFNCDKWHYKGITMHRKDVEKVLGIGNMNFHYVFIWLFFKEV